MFRGGDQYGCEAFGDKKYQRWEGHERKRLFAIQKIGKHSQILDQHVYVYNDGFLLISWKPTLSDSRIFVLWRLAFVLRTALFPLPYRAIRSNLCYAKDFRFYRWRRGLR